jgi:hypothetical protein
MKLNIKVLAASICVAASGFSVTTASADSLLAPLVISDAANGWETLISLKVRGNGAVNGRWARAAQSDLNTTWMRKGTTLASLFNTTSPCTHENTTRRVSAWDMVIHTVDPTNQFLAQTVGVDNSQPTALGGGVAVSTPFYGFAVLDDSAGINGAQEGDASGFAYVNNYILGMMLDYKLLNNHKSTASGNFVGQGFTNNSSADLSWNPVNRDLTLWLGLATGDNMTANIYNNTVKLSQETFDNDATAPTIPVGGGTGVYDNDERIISGDVALNITCMALFGRGDFLNASQVSNTRNGGWKRVSLKNESKPKAGGKIFKAEVKLINTALNGGNLVTSFQPETAGHLFTGTGSTHANRPY